MLILEVSGQLPPKGEPLIADVAAVEEQLPSVDRPHVMVETPGSRGNVEAVWLRAGVAFLRVRLEVIDQCVRRLVCLVAEGALVGTGLNVTIANVLHEPGGSWGGKGVEILYTVIYRTLTSSCNVLNWC